MRTIEDGITSVVVLAGEMLHVAQPFIEKNYHPTVICRALEDAVVVLDKIAMPVDVNDLLGQMVPAQEASLQHEPLPKIRAQSHCWHICLLLGADLGKG